MEKQISLFNKNGINSSNIEKIYGKEKSFQIIKKVIEENKEIMKNIRESEVFEKIKKKYRWKY